MSDGPQKTDGETWARALNGLARKLRGRPRAFPQSQYEFPVNQALVAGAPQVKALRRELCDRAGEQPKKVAGLVLRAPEAVEACRRDHSRYFLSDGRMRGYVFTGTKWRTGWVLLVGDGAQDELARRFEKEQFLVFTSRRGVEPGRVLDACRGEYAGLNRAIRKLTGGSIKRVFLHSLFEHPHSSCSCFGNLAFTIPEVDGIGVMNRGFPGKAPDGRSWDDLANLAAGKQQPGVSGVGPMYLRSERFLQGDGGWERVVWMPSSLKEELGDVIAPGARIATEKDVSSLEQLRAFLSRKPGRRKVSPRQRVDRGSHR